MTLLQACSGGKGGPFIGAQAVKCNAKPCPCLRCSCMEYRCGFLGQAESSFCGKSLHFRGIDGGEISSLTKESRDVPESVSPMRPVSHQACELPIVHYELLLRSIFLDNMARLTSRRRCIDARPKPCGRLHPPSHDGCGQDSGLCPTLVSEAESTRQL